MTTYFANKGEIDIKAVVTLGVNIKPQSESPIGHFGTGLKYAIATLLREGQEIEIWSGLRKYEFLLKEEEIRGTKVKIVYMRTWDWKELSLGFTSTFGKNWTLRDALREIYSNCKDEKGICAQELPLEKGNFLTKPLWEPEKGHTLVIVRGKEFDAEFTRRYDNLLLPPCDVIFENSRIRILDRSSEGIYYHGILATVLRGAPVFSVTFDLLGLHKLSEDRNFASEFDTLRAIAKEICENVPLAALETIFSHGREFDIDLDWSSFDYSKDFIQSLLKRVKTKQRLPYGANAILRRVAERELEEAELPEIPLRIENMLEDAPEVAAEPQSSLWDYKMEAEARMESLERNAKYWKACALSLSARLEAKSSAEVPPNEDEIPF